MVSEAQVPHDAFNSEVQHEQIPPVSVSQAFADSRSASMADPIISHENLNSSLITEDPLQLHHSDHPNYVLATRLLNQNNFSHWKRCVEISLLAKNKLGFVDGSFP